ncbi:hypothetical protein JL49_09090 [Pseudoalteromonas luteoviolacea]|nr:hypothetical protein JL49_09090 [Pseudoalteromonas luteoviolacea]
MSKINDVENSDSFEISTSLALALIAFAVWLSWGGYLWAKESAFDVLLSECKETGRVEMASNAERHAIKCSVVRVIKTTKQDEKL